MVQFKACFQSFRNHNNDVFMRRLVCVQVATFTHKRSSFINIYNESIIIELILKYFKTKEIDDVLHKNSTYTYERSIESHVVCISILSHNKCVYF